MVSFLKSFTPSKTCAIFRKRCYHIFIRNYSTYPLVTTLYVVMQPQTLRVDQRRGHRATGRRSNALAWKQASIGTRRVNIKALNKKSRDIGEI
jgi:hypothetical protein